MTFRSLSIEGEKVPTMKFHRTALTIGSLLVPVYLGSEFGYRVHLYRHLKANYRENKNWVAETPVYAFDSQIGYRYTANLRLRAKSYDASNNLVRSNRLVTNNAGHLSPRDDSYEKPQSEFRIVALGDSFTSCTVSDVSWPTLLEDSLNKDDELKQRVGRSAFKVINLAQDGTGFVQFAKADEVEGQRYRPDLVIVSFITDDITRRFIYRNVIKMHTSGADYQILVTSPSLPPVFHTRECVFATQIYSADLSLFEDKQRFSQIKQDIYMESIHSLPWLDPYPGLLARTVGFRFGLQPEIEFDVDQRNPRFKAGEEAVRQSLDNLRLIASRHSSILVLYHPSERELRSGETPLIGQDLAKRAGNIISMAKFLPTQLGQAEIEKWYIPGDGHPSDYGASVYAKAVHGRVRELLAGSESTHQ
jgi:hypothetical protein